MINTFVVTTTRFLNRFANLCDDKLSAISSQTSKLQTTISILEAKLSSVPDLAAAATAADTSAVPDVAEAAPPPQQASTDSLPTPQSAAATPTPTPSGPPAKEDPTYMAYFKLIRLGMPIQQVKLKCQAEGNDPNILDHPDEPISSAMLALPAPASFDAAAGGASSSEQSTALVTSSDGSGGAAGIEIVVADAAAEAPEEDVNVMKVKDDPEYSKYFKMLMVGIPNPVVKHKMTMDGLDPSILDLSPNSPSPNV